MGTDLLREFFIISKAAEDSTHWNSYSILSILIKIKFSLILNEITFNSVFKIRQNWAQNKVLALTLGFFLQVCFGFRLLWEWTWLSIQSHRSNDIYFFPLKLGYKTDKEVPRYLKASGINKILACKKHFNMNILW